MVANTDRNGAAHVSAEQKFKDLTCVFLKTSGNIHLSLSLKQNGHTLYACWQNEHILHVCWQKWQLRQKNGIDIRRKAQIC